MLSVATKASSTGLGTQLEGVVGREHVRTDEGALLTFSTDATLRASARLVAGRQQ